MKIIQKINF